LNQVFDKAAPCRLDRGMAKKAVVKKVREEARETPERIMEAAFRLFAEGGFEAVSLREITAEADANIAAVNYHFGSKEGLIATVLERQVRPVSVERLERLNQLEGERGGREVSVGELMEAFLAPLLTRVSAQPERLFLKFMGRMMTERGYDLPESVMPMFREVTERFAAALGRGLPGVGKAEIFWRLHFASGVMAHLLLQGEQLQRISAGHADDPTPAEKLRRAVAFCAAGFSQGQGGGEARKAGKPDAAAPPEAAKAAGSAEAAAVVARVDPAVAGNKAQSAARAVAAVPVDELAAGVREVQCELF
jgi:AcrR family transcriptional regulator